MRWILVLALLVACEAPEPEQLPQPPPNYPSATPVPQPARIPAVPAAALSISHITVNQGVAVDVMRDFEVVQGLGPLVVGKEALVRVHLAPHLDWEEREVRGSLAIHTPDQTLVFEEQLLVSGASDPGDLQTTIEGVVPAWALAEGVSLSAAVYEVDGVARDVSEGRARWPSSGAQELTFDTWAAGLRVHVVPVVYRADGSDRRPDTSDEQLELLRDYLVRLYPTDDVELVVTEELPWDGEITSNQGMGDLLDLLVDEREARQIPWNEYFFGLVTPAETRSNFCITGCVAGLSYRPDNPNQVWMRSSLALGYSGLRTAETMAHELGHAHGRRHAPCGDPSQVDPLYPYAGGLTGSWGWDGEELVPPGVTGDIMGYCSPKWISDYQVAGLYDRLSALAGLPGPQERDPQEVRWVAEAADGTLTDRGLRVRTLDGGEAHTLRAAVGDGFDRVEARFYGYEDQPGGAWLLPALGAKSLTWPDGRTVELSAP